MRITRQRIESTLLYRFVTGCLLAACWISGFQLCFGQTLKDDLLQRRVTLHVKDGTLLEALGRLAGEESIPIGWELSQSDLVNHNISIDLIKVPLKDVLDRLVLADSAYQWKLEDGVINFYPAFDRDARLQEFLSLRIKEFNPPKGLSVFAFRDAVLDLPEVQKFLLSNGLEASHSGNCCGGGISYVTRDFRTANAELRSILNELIRDGHLRMWTLSRNGESRQFVHLSL
jgi:hypothetical protein